MRGKRGAHYTGDTVQQTFLFRKVPRVPGDLDLFSLEPELTLRDHGYR